MRTIGFLASLVFLSACDSHISSQLPQPKSLTYSNDESSDVSISTQISEGACRYLWQQQRPDGSWRSSKYGILSSGQAYTPFVLYALLRFDVHPNDEGVKLALRFMRGKIRDGAMGRADPDVLEYPVYSTAYALMCFKLAGLAEDKNLIREMEAFLLSEQFTEQRGFEPEDVAYGGWGFGGVQPPGQTGHMDLAHVRRVLQALSLNSGRNNLSEVRRRAATFLKIVQKHPSDHRPQPLPNEFVRITDARQGYDGGFYFSPIVHRANKGRLSTSDPPFWNSYSTATCEGLLALLAANVSTKDERVAGAIEWLKRHELLDYPQGIPESYEGENWREAVWFYHISVRGEVARATNNAEAGRKSIAAQLEKHQNTDGSFVNRKSSLMKEDDPILCTALALIGIGKQGP